VSVLTAVHVSVLMDERFVGAQVVDEAGVVALLMGSPSK
jgi:hypothetical protein